jgi:hypothetical protein
MDVLLPPESYSIKIHREPSDQAEQETAVDVLSLRTSLVCMYHVAMDYLPEHVHVSGN